jgi:hypothetical protein
LDPFTTSSTEKRIEDISNVSKLEAVVCDSKDDIQKKTARFRFEIVDSGSYRY